MNPLGLTRLLLAATALAAASACKPRQNTAPTSAASTPVAPARAAAGLEVWLWTIADPPAPPKPSRAAEDANTEPEQAAPPAPPAPPDELEQLLEPFIGAPDPFDPAARARLQSLGLRLALVPTSQLPAVEARARLVGVVQRQELGVVPLWTEILRTSLREPLPLPPHAKDLGPGTLRIAARAWLIPAADDTAALHLDLAAQHQPSASPTRTLADFNTTAKPPEPRTIPLAGPAAVTATLDGTHAILIVPTQGALSDALLTIPASTAAPRLRRVIVLIPHVPPRFELLP